MTTSIDMSTPVTRGELREEIKQLEIRIDQRFEQVDQRFEQIDQRLANLATKADLEAWVETLMAHMQTELARHFGALQEWMSAQFSILGRR